jgi:hypothetical protein
MPVKDEGEFEEYPVLPNREYLYTHNFPPGCQGRKYKAVYRGTHVPTYQDLILFVCTEKDASQNLMCTNEIFGTHFRLVSIPEPPPVPEKVAGAGEPVHIWEPNYRGEKDAPKS